MAKKQSYEELLEKVKKLEKETNECQQALWIVRM